MRNRKQRVRVSRTVAALALGAGSFGLSGVTAAGASAAPVAPHQWFVGQVGGVSANATIKVGCFGPATPGQTGHPIAGQYVSVAPAVTVTSPEVGYTGEAADRVVVDFGSGTSTGTAAVLKEYGVRAAIPTTIDLPCLGTGRVLFIPVPTSTTARAAAVTVTYVNVGV
ncbi:hypothetical protein [Streptomyces sp.]|uniref:hypothetical protein n=1 Tax=Streptomyces sp. TaxID=1931 RepID=UPI002F3F5CF2